MSGKTYDPVRKPTRMAQELFKGKVKIQKIESGSNHSLALTTDGKVYGWGDAESGKIGRMLTTRNKN
jgi:alpha-tubulin suppressor-like RCC1 family protein